MAVITASWPAWPSGSCCAACSSSWSCGPCTWKPCSDISSSLSAVIGDPAKTMALLAGLRGARLGGELCAVPGRKEGVAVEVGVDLGQYQLVGQRQHFGIDLTAADHEDLGLAAHQRECRRQRVCPLGAVSMPFWVACDDDVATPRQWPADRVPGLAPHDHRVAERRALEKFQVFRDADQQLVVLADGAVARDGGDETQHRTRHGAALSQR